jgi:hypothetical protein
MAPCYFFNPLKIQDGRHGSDWQRHFFGASFPELLHVTSTDLLEMFPPRSVFTFGRNLKSKMIALASDWL